MFIILRLLFSNCRKSLILWIGLLLTVTVFISTTACSQVESEPEPSLTGETQQTEKSNNSAQQIILPAQFADTLILHDLDQDGTEERIRYTPQERSSRVALSINDDTLELDGNFVRDYFFLVILDVEDGKRDIALLELGGLTFSQVTFIHYDGSTANVIGTIPSTNLNDGKIDDQGQLGDLVLDGHGGIQVPTRSDLLCTWFFDSKWTLNPAGRLEVITQERYSIRQPLTLIMKTDLSLRLEPNDESLAGVARAGETVTLIKSDNKKWIQAQTSAGLSGWFAVAAPAGSNVIDHVDIGSGGLISGHDVFENLPVGN